MTANNTPHELTEQNAKNRAVFTDAPGADHAELVILSSNGQRPLALDLDLGEDDLRVELAGREDSDEPYGLQVVHAGTPLHSQTVSESFFDSGSVKRDRFTRLAGRRLAGVVDGVDESTATTALTDALGDIREHFAADAVHIIDPETREPIEKTAAVTYSPDGDGDLIVTFDDVDFSGNNFAFFRSQTTIPARQWADASSPPNLRVDGVRRVFNGSKGRARWQSVRRIWMRMATIGGEVPPREVPLTADDLRSRGTVPKINVDVDAIQETAREDRKFNDVRKELGVSRAHESILNAAIEKLGLGGDVSYGMMKP